MKIIHLFIFGILKFTLLQSQKLDDIDTIKKANVTYNININCGNLNHSIKRNQENDEFNMVETEYEQELPDSIQKHEYNALLLKYFQSKNENNKSTTVSLLQLKSPVIGNNFSGNDIGTSTPLDNSIAIANNGWIVSVTNSILNIYKADSCENSGISIPLTTYFEKYFDDIGPVFDPHVIYDLTADRFIFVCITGTNEPAKSKFLIGFSKSNNPNDGWWPYTASGNPFDDNSWVDYPNIGISENEMYLTGNLIDKSSGNKKYNPSIIYTFRKSIGYSGGNYNSFPKSVSLMSNLIGNPISILPVSDGQSSKGAGIYLISTFEPSISNSGIQLYHITDDLPNDPDLIYNVVPSLPYLVPSVTSQLNYTKDSLQTGDRRIRSGFYLNGIIHFVFSSKMNSGWTGIVYNRLDVITLKNISDNIEEEGSACAYPSVASFALDESDKSVMIAFCKSGPNIYPEIRVTLFDDNMNQSNQSLVRKGDDYVDVLNKQIPPTLGWGDYTGICRKHNSSFPSVWLSAAYGTSGHKWDTWISEVHAGILCDQPKNDGCNQSFEAIKLDINSTCNSTLFNTCGATISGFVSCSSYPNEEDDDIFFTFQPPLSGNILVRVDGALGFNPQFQLLTGPCGMNMQELPDGCSEPGGLGGSSELLIKDLNPSEQYFIRVWNVGCGYGTSDNSSICIKDAGKTIEPYCDGIIKLDALTGSFSDGSGLRKYSPNSDCSWLIQPNTANFIILNFTKFNTEEKYDKVIVYDGDNANATILGEFSGSNIPQSIESSGGVMLVRFLSNNSVNGNGWSASYTSITSQVSNSNIIGYEYWFDDSYNQKIFQTISPRLNFNLTNSLNTLGLNYGLHILHMRFKDDHSLWSSVTSQHFYKFPSSNFMDNKIVNYEYWFDNDYAGKVMQNVSPQNPLQLLTDINVNSLNTGLHIFHSRFKDTRSQWSNVVSQHFFKLPSSSFVDNKIIEYEYWFDNDYANKVLTSESPQNTLQLINDIKTNTLAQGLHIFHTRFKDAKSLWSSVVSQHFYKSRTNLAFPNFVNGFRYWIDLDTSKVTSVSIPVTTNPRYVLTDLNLANLDTGAHLITLQFRDLNGLYSHVISDTFYQLGKPRLDKITPDSAGNIGLVTINILGTGFYNGTKVQLIRPGIDTINAPFNQTIIVNGSKIETTVNLLGQTTGYYDVVVTIPNDTVMILKNGFKVVEGIPVKLWSTLQGFNFIRPNQWQNYSVTVGNEGNINATAVPFWISIPQNAEIKFDFPITNPYGNDFNYDTIQNEFLTEYVWETPSNSKLRTFVIARIPPKQSRTINFRIKTSTNSNFEIQSWVNRPLYDRAENFDMQPDDCLKGLLEKLVLINVDKYIDGADYIQCFYKARKNIVTIWKDSPWGDLIYGSGTTKDNFGETEYILDYSRSLLSMALSCIKATFDPSDEIKSAISLALNFNFLVKTFENCNETFYTSDKIIRNTITPIRSFDPNDKIGPSGVGINQFVTVENPMTYIVNFETLKTSSASAQNVCIIDTLDKNVFDLSTLELGFVRIMDTVLLNSPGTKSFSKLLDLRPKNDLIVKIEGGLNEITGVLKWTFTSLDPITLLPITNPLAGFLPPNVTSPEGEGSVFYSIRVKKTIPNNTVVANKACIYFDSNEAICTNTWKNTIDKINPHSKVSTLPTFINDTTFKVSWSGIDTSSGVQEYSVFYSTNGGPYLPWIINTTDTCKTFYGTLNSVYRFYSIAKDSVGNIEQKSIFPDAITTITCQKPTITCPSNIQALSSGDGCGAIVNFSFGVSNFCLEQTISKISGLASGSYFPIGITMNTFKVTDNFNNTATCSFTVTVSEKIAPIIKCPYSLLRKNDIGKCGANINFTATAMDNCDLQPIISYNYPSGSFFPTGVTKVTATATDKSGNSSSCYFNITVSDTQRPDIICPVYQVRYTENGLCKYSVKSNELDPMVSDNCGILAKNYTLSGATLGNGLSTLNNILFNQGLTTINWTASDINDKTKLNSNLSSCSFSILVKDSVPPKLICPVDVQFTTPPGQCTVGFNATPLGIPSGITDNCAGHYPVINNDPKIYPVGLTNVIWTASDISGNKRTCTQKVTVIPYLCNAPTIVTTTDITKNAARIKWQASACSSEYQVSIRQEITNGVWGTWSNWISNNGPGLSHLFSGLTANKYYNFQLRSRCGTVYSTIVNGKFWTKVNSSSPELKTRKSEEEEDNSGHEPNITVIPNPASNFATVSIEGYDKSEKKIIMSTLFGHRIFEAQLDATTNNLELDLKVLHATTGVYMIRVTNSSQHNTVQLMVVQ